MNYANVFITAVEINKSLSIIPPANKPEFTFHTTYLVAASESSVGVHSHLLHGTLLDISKVNNYIIRLILIL